MLILWGLLTSTTYADQPVLPSYYLEYGDLLKVAVPNIYRKQNYRVLLAVHIGKSSMLPRSTCASMQDSNQSPCLLYSRHNSPDRNEMVQYFCYWSFFIHSLITSFLYARDTAKTVFDKLRHTNIHVFTVIAFEFHSLIRSSRLRILSRPHSLRIQAETTAASYAAWGIESLQLDPNEAFDRIKWHKRSRCAGFTYEREKD